MIKISDKILHRLGKYGINEKDFFHYFNYFEDKQMLIMLLQSMGLPLIKHKRKYILKTALTPINKDIFCIFDLETIGILIPGKNLPCFSLLSSTIHSISLEIPKKFNAVVAFAGDP